VVSGAVGRTPAPMPRSSGGGRGASRCRGRGMRPGSVFPPRRPARPPRLKPIGRAVTR